MADPCNLYYYYVGCSRGGALFPPFLLALVYTCPTCPEASFLPASHCKRCTYACTTVSVEGMGPCRDGPSMLGPLPVHLWPSKTQARHPNPPSSPLPPAEGPSSNGRQSIQLVVPGSELTRPCSSVPKGANKNEVCSADMKERRFRRYEVDRPLRAVVAPRTPWSLPLRGRCLAISEGGLEAIFPEHLAPGRIVYLELAPALKVCAEVRNRRSFHYGLEFMQVNEAQREAIKQLCQSQPPSRQIWKLH